MNEEIKLVKYLAINKPSVNIKKSNYMLSSKNIIKEKKINREF